MKVKVVLNFDDHALEKLLSKKNKTEIIKDAICKMFDEVQYCLDEDYEGDDIVLEGNVCKTNENKN